MVLSQKHKILYVAVPKTATTAVQEWLLSEDSSFKKGHHQLCGKSVHLEEHITANEAKKLLGEDYYDTLSVIGFIRHPNSRIISSYNFYRQGGKRKSLWYHSNHKKLSLRVHHFLQFFLAKILPFEIWIFVYPYRDNKRYFVDENDRIIVSHIGIYENLAKDLSWIIQSSGLKLNGSALKKVNKSNKYTKGAFLSKSFIQVLLGIRHRNFQEDLKFYNRIKKIR